MVAFNTTCWLPGQGKCIYITIKCREKRSFLFAIKAGNPNLKAIHNRSADIPVGSGAFARNRPTRMSALLEALMVGVVFTKMRIAGYVGVDEAGFSRLMAAIRSYWVFLPGNYEKNSMPFGCLLLGCAIAALRGGLPAGRV
jgi:hypothetical protein